MTSQTRQPFWCLLIAAILLATGCQSSLAPAPSAKASRQQSPKPGAIDPCAERLHEICGSLLMYYALNRRLPEKLSELIAMGDIDRPIHLTCPVSGKPYVYSPTGLKILDRPGRVIIFDPEPSHGVKRWAIIIQESEGPLITDVLPVPEEGFTRYFKQAAGGK